MRLLAKRQRSRRRQRQADPDLEPARPILSYRGARRPDAPRPLKRRPVFKLPPINNQVINNQGVRFWLQRVLLLLVLGAVVASVTNILSLSADAKIMTLGTTGNRSLLRPVETYQSAADQDLSASLWNRNKITIDTGQLSRQLTAQFPELKAVSITIPLLAHRPLIYIQPAQPALVLVTKNGSAFVIDTSGKVLLDHVPATKLSQLNLPTIQDQSGLRINLNSQALPADNVRFIQGIVLQLTAKQFKVSGMVLPSASSELDVNLANQPYFVKFNLQSNDPRGQAGTFLATINLLNQQHVTPAHYVDVRVSGRAYYQ